MIYKTKKRIELDFDTKLKSYVYKGKPIAQDAAEKIKHKWALKDLMENAAKDSEFTPLGLAMFKILINNMTIRELTAKNQSLTYHSIKRYVECVSKYYNVSMREVTLPEVKRPHIAPMLSEVANPWAEGKRVEGVFHYKGVAYEESDKVGEVYKLVTVSALYACANQDDDLSALANKTGAPLLASFAKVAHLNNDLKDSYKNIYDYLKHLIITIDRYFDLTLDSNTKINVGQSRLTGTMYYCLTSE